MQSGFLSFDIQLLVDKFPNLIFQLADFSWISLVSHKFTLSSLDFWQTTIISGFFISVISILETMISAKIA
jgi:hypothetical protein